MEELNLRRVCRKQSVKCSSLRYLGTGEEGHVPSRWHEDQKRTESSRAAMMEDVGHRATHVGSKGGALKSITRCEPKGRGPGLTFHRRRKELKQGPLGSLVFLSGYPRPPRSQRKRGPEGKYISSIMELVWGVWSHPQPWPAGMWGLDFSSNSQKTQVLIPAVCSDFALSPLNLASAQAPTPALANPSS